MHSCPNLCVGPREAPDKYTLLRQVGGGGEAVLWLAELSVDGAAEPVAVKELRPDHLDDIARHSARWAEQAELLRFVRHPGVVAVREHFQGAPMHGVGEANGDDGRSLYLVMNWVEGRSLSAWVSSNRELLGSAQALEHLEQVAEVLDLLHSGRTTPSGREIVHGDLSPQNVMITPAGQAVLVDFGLARLSTHKTHNAAGTPGYTAPEVWTSGDYSPAGDRYSFGALSYLMLTGTNPPSTHAAIRDGLASHSLLAGVSAAAVDRLMSIFSVEAGERPSATDWLRVLRNSAPTRSVLASAEENTEALSAVPKDRDPATHSAKTPAGAQARAEEQPVTGGELMTRPPEQELATRSRPKLLYAILAGVTALALVVAGVVIVPQLVNKPTEVFAEGADTVGPNPFVTGVVPPTPPVTPVTVPSNGTVTPNVAGDTPGLYGGVQSNPGYDTTQLASSLQNDPAKARAWTNSVNGSPSGIDTTSTGGSATSSSGGNANSSSGGILGASPGIDIVSIANIPVFLDELTIMITRVPIRTGSVSYAGGHPVLVQVLLGPGTAVLVTRYGVPVVRVISGSPLLPPIPVRGTPIWIGTGWPGWNPNTPYNTVSPASQAIWSFTVYDLATGQLYELLVGVAARTAHIDQLAPPVAAARPSPPPAAAAQPASPPSPPAYRLSHPIPRKAAPSPQEPAPVENKSEPSREQGNERSRKQSTNGSEDGGDGNNDPDNNPGRRGGRPPRVVAPPKATFCGDGCRGAENGSMPGNRSSRPPRVAAPPKATFCGDGCRGAENGSMPGNRSSRPPRVVAPPQKIPTCHKVGDGGYTCETKPKFDVLGH
jgi:serine/threonine protein kinase